MDILSIFRRIVLAFPFLQQALINGNGRHRDERRYYFLRQTSFNFFISSKSSSTAPPRLLCVFRQQAGMRFIIIIGIEMPLLLWPPKILPNGHPVIVLQMHRITTIPPPSY